MSGFDEAALVEVLRSAQSLGFLGDRPVEEAIDHSRAVVAGLDGVTGRVVDLGAGGGLPGLVIVHDRPDLHLELVDRRAKRTDFLERMVRRHGLSARVDVTSADADVLAQACDRGERSLADASVARGFGPPERTLRVLRRLVRPGGRLVVTEPPTGDRWPPGLLSELGVDRCGDVAGVAIFERAAVTS